MDRALPDNPCSIYQTVIHALVSRSHTLVVELVVNLFLQWFFHGVKLIAKPDQRFGTRDQKLLLNGFINKSMVSCFLSLSLPQTRIMGRFKRQSMFCHDPLSGHDSLADHPLESLTVPVPFCPENPCRYISSYKISLGNPPPCQKASSSGFTWSESLHRWCLCGHVHILYIHTEDV